MGNTPADMDGDGGDGDDDDPVGGKGEKKKKNTYKHLIKGIPGVLLFPDYLFGPCMVSNSLKKYIFNRKTLFEKRRFSNESYARTPKAKDENSSFRS